MTRTATKVEAPLGDGFSFALNMSEQVRYTATRATPSTREGGTSNSAEGLFSALVRRDHEPTPTVRGRLSEMIGAEHQKVVCVDVREVDDDVAKGVIRGLGGQDVSVTLPLGLFPDEAKPRLGKSYNLEMVVVNGIRRPTLTARAPSVDALREQKQALRALVGRISGN